MFILLANIFNYTFNLFINSTVKEPVIDEFFQLYILFWRLDM